MINFDLSHKGSYQYCGRIDLPWEDVEKDLASYADEQTMNWSIINNNTYQDEASKLQNEYIKYGYSDNNTRSWKTTNFDPKITFPWENIIHQALPLEHAVIAIHRQDPGQILPWHLDRFFMLKRLYPKDKRPIYRFLMFMEDWKIGHILEIEDTILTTWKRGDVIVWHPGTLHLSANVGLEKKWTCNITGFLKK
jgi:hypothetical protein